MRSNLTAEEQHVPSTVQVGGSYQTKQMKPSPLVYGMVFVNFIGEDLLAYTPPTSYPRGTVIVRQKLLDGSPEELVVMVKHQPGFNPACGDWEFLELSGDSTKIQQRQKVGSCQECHAKAANQDFVFRSYIKVSDQPAKKKEVLGELIH